MKLKEILENQKIRSIISESWSVSWPMTFIMFFEFLIGLADVYVAGKFGKEAQAAYGIAFQLYFVFIIIAMALNVGTVSVISRLFTSGKKEEFTTAVHSSLIAAGAAGIAAGAAGILLAGHIVNIFNVPPLIKKLAVPLIMIYSAGFFFDYILMNTNAVLRASNMIRRSFFTMAIVCLLNITLNFALAFGTGLGLKGIAVATVISLFAGSMLNIFYARKLVIRTFKFSLSFLKKILSIGWPSGLMSMLWQLGAMALFLILSLLPENSVETIAAFTNGLKIESVIFLAAFAFNMAGAVVVGNLLGKGEKEDAFHGGIITAVMGVMVVFVLTVFTLFNARAIASFLSDNGAVISECVRYIYISLIFEPLMAWGIILAGGLNGAGDTKRVMSIVALGIWLVRIPAAYLLGIRLGLGAPLVWWSMNLSIIFQSICVSKRYFGKKWIFAAERNIAV